MNAEETSLARSRRLTRTIDGRDEFNLAEFPLTLLSDRHTGRDRTLEWDDEIIDKGTSLPVKRKVIVTASDAFGLPTAGDADVLFALVQLTKSANNFSSRDVPFSRYELIRLLGWNDEGKSYKRLEMSLNRWVGTTIYFSAWRDKRSETWQSEKFHIIDNVTLMSGDHRRRLRARGQEELARSSFSWNKIVFQNLQAGYVSPVDPAVYFALKSAVAKRAFRYLTKHFRLRRQGELTFDLKVFAFEKIGLSRTSRDAGQIKKELQGGLEELESIGFLKTTPRDQRYMRISPGKWLIRLIKNGAPLAPPAPDVEEPERGSSIVRDLVERGVTETTAIAISREFPTSEVEARIEVFDWLAARKQGRVSKNPGGFLVESIRKGYAPPKGFESRADLARRVATDEARHHQAETLRRSAEDRKRLREESDEARVTAYWESLSPMEQILVREEALRETSSFLATQYRKHQGTGSGAEALYSQAIMHEHLVKIING